MTTRVTKLVRAEHKTALYSQATTWEPGSICTSTAHCSCVVLLCASIVGILELPGLDLEPVEVSTRIAPAWTPLLESAASGRRDACEAVTDPVHERVLAGVQYWYVCDVLLRPSVRQVRVRGVIDLPC